MDFNNKKNKILEILKEGELATTKIAFLITSNLYQAEVYLNELEEDGLIIHYSKNNATYWKLKNGKEV